MSVEPRARAAFLDRDGTIIVEENYLSDPARVRLIPGAVEALRLLRAAGFKLVVVTNQSGIARGFYTVADYRAVQARVEEILAQEGIQLDGVFFCPHHPDYTGPCDCRKPGPGLYRQAAEKLDLDLASSVYIGDRLQDVAAAAAFGGRAWLVRTGHGKGETQLASDEIDVVEDVLEAASAIVAKTRTAP